MPIKKTVIEAFKDGSKKIVQHPHSTPVFDKGVEYKCFWCDLPITSTPIGCPIRETGAYIEKRVRIRNNDDDTIQIVKREHLGAQPRSYVTEKTFCSFNCVKAYIVSKNRDVRYKDSITLLAQIYSLTTGQTGPVTIHPSPCKSTMIAYGGFLTPEQYRKTLGKVLYTPVDVVTLHPLSELYTETLRV